MRGNYIRLLFFGIVLMLVFISIMTYRSLNNYIEEVKLIRHSNKVLRALQEVLASVKDAEVGHRGFQLTRDSSYLGPYFASLNVLPRQIYFVDSLLSTDPQQSIVLDTLELRIQSQFDIINQILSNAGRSSLYMDQYESNLLSRGKANMEEIRRLIRKINDREETLFTEHVSREKSYQNTTPIALLMLAVIALIGMTFLFTRILDLLSKQRSTEKILKKNVDDLRHEASIREAQQRVIEERGLLLKEAESIAHMGSWKWFEGSGKFIWSDGLYRIWGKPQQSFQPTWESFLENVYEEDRNTVQSYINRVRQDRVEAELDFRIQLMGNIKYVLMSTRLQSSVNDHQNDILGTVQDVTEHKLYESQLKKFTDELQRSNQDLEQFAYVASHDLQEPLRKIRAFGDLLNNKYPEKLDKTGASYIARMHSAAERMQTLIEDLLSFSRVSRAGVSHETLALGDVLKEVLEDLEERVKKHKAILEIGPLPIVQGERTELKRLLQNLISNAIKFSKPDIRPKIVIAGKVVSRREAEEEFKIILATPSYARISVKDNGIGFDQRYAERIFNIFQRLHGPMEYEGTGIGLAICRKIVTKHGGAIFATGEEGQGSEFIFILPVN